ncbi:MAG TPA: hypothetical protein VGF57_10390, partial [Roseiarcus sp.]
MTAAFRDTLALVSEPADAEFFARLGRLSGIRTNAAADGAMLRRHGRKAESANCGKIRNAPCSANQFSLFRANIVPVPAQKCPCS